MPKPLALTFCVVLLLNHDYILSSTTICCGKKSRQNPRTRMSQRKLREKCNTNRQRTTRHADGYSFSHDTMFCRTSSRTRPIAELPLPISATLLVENDNISRSAYCHLLYAQLLYSQLLYSQLLYSHLFSSQLLYTQPSYSQLRYFTLSSSTLSFATLSYSTLNYATTLLSATLLSTTLLSAILLSATLLSATLTTISYSTLSYFTLSYYQLLCATLSYFLLIFMTT